MSPETKNGKHYTNNINIFLSLIIVLISINLQGFADNLPTKEGFVIVIDPGHGGNDPGAVGSMSSEKNITLAIALKTGSYIEENLRNVKVVYTRKSDESVGLSTRSDIANKNSADLFISIHANSTGGSNAYGTETYVMGHSMDQANLDVAIKENQVIYLEKDYSTKYEGFDPKSPESYVMFTLVQNIYLKQSTELASMIQTQYKDQVGRFDRGVKQAGFYVLYKTGMPSVLTETGFISNRTEEKYINSEKGQNEIAMSIFRACKDYLAEISKKSINPSQTEDYRKNDTGSVTDSSDYKGKTVFMVQVVTSAKKIEIKPSNFRNLSNVTQLISGNKFRYATGIFTEYNKALEYRKVVEKVYPDAFVIAVRDNKILPLREAIEKKPKK